MFSQLRQLYRERRAFAWIMLVSVGILFTAPGLVLLPSFFRTEATVHIRTGQPGNHLPDGFYVYQALLSQGIHIKSITPGQNALVIKFESQEQSIAAEKVLRELLPVDVEIARRQKNNAEPRVNRVNLRT